MGTSFRCGARLLTDSSIVKRGSSPACSSWTIDTQCGGRHPPYASWLHAPLERSSPVSRLLGLDGRLGIWFASRRSFSRKHCGSGRLQSQIGARGANAHGAFVVVQKGDQILPELWKRMHGHQVGGRCAHRPVLIAQSGLHGIHQVWVARVSDEQQRSGAGRRIGC